MATVINLKVKSDFAAASADLKKFGAVTEAQAKKIDEFQKSFKDENIKSFNDRLRRSTAAIKATRGPTAAMISEHRTLQREIEKLIRRGLDPAGKEIKQLTTQYKKLEAEIEDVTKAQRKSQASMKRTEGAMLAIGAGAIFAGKQLFDAFIGFSRESAKAASDAEEIEGKFKVVFGGISEEATDAAATIAKEFDLANSTVNKLLGDTGDILTGLGFDQKTALDLSTQVGTLALDLASFTNFAGGAEGASAALTKALLGEAESAKALGIVIRQDTKEYKDMIKQIMEAEGVGLVQAKALAALTIATEQSKNAIGDYARTQDSAANTQRRLEESTKSLKEAYGVSINEALTPLRSMLSDITKEWANMLDVQNQAIAFSKDLKDGTIDEKLSLEELQVVLQGLEKQRGQAGRRGFIEDDITAVKELIANYEHVSDRINKNAQAAAGFASLQKLAADEEVERLAIAAEALLAIEDLRVAGLSTKEKELENLNAQIEKWAEFERTVEVQQLLNELISQRNELIVVGNEEVETSFVNLTFQANAYKNSLMDAEFAHVKFTAKTKKGNEDLKLSFTDLAVTGLGAITQGFKDIGEAVATGSLTWNDFAKLGLTALSAVLDGLGAQLAALAVVHALALDFGGAALAVAGSIAAFGASGLVSAAAGSFQTGTGSPFQVPESNRSSSADSQRIAVSPGEQVQVTPRGESGGGNQNVSIAVDSQVIFDIVTEGIQSGDIPINNDNIQFSGRATA